MFAPSPSHSLPHLTPSPPPSQTPQQLIAESGVVSKETRKYIFHSLSDLTRLSSRGNSKHQSLVEQLDCLQFVSLLASMLTFDPANRSTPSQALQCPFITMHHLAAHTSDSRYVCVSHVWTEAISSLQCPRLDPVYARVPPLSNYQLLSTHTATLPHTLLPSSHSCPPTSRAAISIHNTACLPSFSPLFLSPLPCHLPSSSLLFSPAK